MPEPYWSLPRVQPEGGQAPHLMVWSHIFTVQSELQDMKMCSSLGMCAAPASGLPGPPLHPRKTLGLRLLVTHGRKLCRQ